MFYALQMRFPAHPPLFAQRMRKFDCAKSQRFFGRLKTECTRKPGKRGGSEAAAGFGIEKKSKRLRK